MQGMSGKTAALLLWFSGFLLVPVPYQIIADGSVPPVRMALLGLVSAAYAAGVDGTGVAWPLTALLLAHAILYSLALAVPAWVLARLLPEPVRGAVIWGCVALGFAAAVFFEVYRTPFDDASSHASWPGLFQ
jgi:hypothetical protein